MAERPRRTRTAQVAAPAEPAPGTVAYCAIFPGIGVARVGNSPTGFFLGPETPGQPVEPPGGFKDAQGRVKRQAARFRVYAFDERGQALREITAAEADITWTVHLANKKASWFRFQGYAAEEQASHGGDPLPPRNARVADRDSLVIDPGPRTITGGNTAGPSYRFDGGTFQSIDVSLGELRTDAAGRLLVLGGFGRSESALPENPIVHYANNDGWFDDTSDGPVTAAVVLKTGEAVPVKGSSWAVVAPPDYAPSIGNLVSLYDVMLDVARSQGWLPGPDKVSFTGDVYPILARVAGYPWVNATAGRGHRPGARPPVDQSQGTERVGDFLAPARLAALADSSTGSRAARQQVFDRLRNPVPATPEDGVRQANFFFMPQLSGDGGDLTEGDPSTWMALLPSQHLALKRWAEGDFEPDWGGAPPSPVAWTDIPVRDQPAALDRAVLENCVGGPFFPGIEMTYIARDPSFFSGPFRLRPDLEPGDAGKRMAVPWQADFYKCQGFWWPAQRPDDVITEGEYEAITAPYRPEADELGHLPPDLAFRRVSWDRGVGDRVSFQGAAGRVVARRRTKGHNGMVDEWSDLGFVVPRQSPDGASTFWVEVDRDPYAALRDRDYFHIMMNLENNAEFLPKAKSLAEDFLAQARQLQIDVAVEDDLKPFRYDPRAFSARLDKIYGALLDAGNAYNPATDQVFNTREAVVELIRQTAPFNQTDGAWLREVGEVGPIDQVHSLLFSVLADETGNGDPRLNHANLFTDLLHSVGVFPPDIRSREYVDDPELLDSAFTLPLFQMVISQFSENYFAEILGMTLYLEWEVLGLTPIVKMMEFHGVDAHFYRMHIAIDNAAEGHGARAKRAVQLYLEQVRNESGEDAAQHQWRRIWDGYVTFKTTGTVGSDLVGKILNRTTPPLANQVAAMMARKKPYGQLNHDGKRLGDNLINDLFEDPGTFMNALQAAGMIVPGDVANSPFFKLLTWDGPMYKVFTDAEIQLWKDWTESLAEPGPEPAPGPDPTVVELMVRLIETMRNRQEGTGGHQANQLTGPDPANPGQTTTQPVAFWFRQPTPLFMQALANPDNGWIVPGNAAASRFVNELLRGDRPMGRALSGVAPGTSHRTWRSVAIDWINAGCPIPTDQLMLTLAPVLRDEGEVRTMAASRPVRHLTVVTPLEEVAANPQGRILGLGTVH